MSIDEQVRPFVDIELAEFVVLRGAERDSAVLGLDREIRRLTVKRAAMIHSVARAATFTDDAHHTARAWVQAVLNSSAATAAELVRTGALLHEIPDLADAVAAGRIGWDQVREMTQLFTNVRCRDELAAHGTGLVDPAARLVFDDFRKVVARWKAHADPDGTHRDHQASRERRHVRTGTVCHQGVIHAEGDAAAIEEMIDILEAHAQSEFLKDCEESTLRHGDDADRHPLRRTAGQRRFDALQEVFRKAAGTPVAGATEPTVNIFTTEADLSDAVREYFGQPPLGQPPFGEKADRQRLCETEQGASVNPHDMVVAALLGRIRKVVVTEDGRYVSSGSNQRLFTGKLREMILLLGGHRCNKPGCNVSGPSVQVDHIESWTCGGCTSASNGGPLCPLHNRDKHRLGFTVTHDEHGWHHYRPNGTEIAPRGG